MRFPCFGKANPRTAIVIFLLLSTGALGVGSVGFRRKVVERRPADGVVWMDRESGRPEAGWVREDGPAGRVGLRQGDLLIAINGQEVGRALEVTEILWELPLGVPATYSVLHGGEPRVFPVSLDFRPATRPLYSYLAIVGLFFLVAGLIVVLRLPSDPIASVFFFLCLGQFVLLVFSPTGKAERFDWFLYWGDQISRLLAPALILHLAIRFPRRKDGRGRFPYLLYAPAAAFLLFNVYLLEFGGLRNLPDPLALLRGKDRAELALAAVFLLGACAWFLASYLRAADSRSRDQLRWVGFGTAIGLLPFTILYLLPRGFGFPQTGWWELSAFPLVLLPLCLAAAIASYRIVELEYFLKKGIIALAIGFFLMAVFLASSITWHAVLAPYLAAADQVASVLAAVTAVLLVPGVRRLATSLVDHLFYSSRYDLRKTLLAFGRDLCAIHDLHHLVSAFTERVRGSLAVEDVQVFLRKGDGPRFQQIAGAGGTGSGKEEVGWDVSAIPDRPLRGDSAEVELTGEGVRFPLVLPMRVGGRVTALLAVRGEGEGGRVRREDRDLLVTLCGQAAGALESARLHDELQGRIREVERLRLYSEGILESSRVGIVVVDPNGAIQAWSGAMADLFGLDRKSAVDRAASEIFPEDFLSRVGVAGSHRQASWGERFSRYPLKTAGGKMILVNVNVSRLVPSAGSPGGTVITFDDVTEQVRMQEQLAQKEKLAAVGLLAAGVAHEVNTPLTAISSYAQMLLSGRRQRHEERRMLKQIEDQAFRASEIANRLLDLARSEGDLHEMVPVRELVRETLSLFAPQVRGKRVRIETRLGEGVPAVVGNRGRLQQVLLNLLWNGAEAMPEGGFLEVITRHQRGEVRIEVRDFGRGIPPEDLSRIYDPFFSTRRSEGGTGLGLSVSYGIVRDHGGRLEVETETGAGSRFTICLPSVPSRVRKAG